MKLSVPSKIIIPLVAFLVYAGLSSAQTPQDEFGQNRVQYKNFSWSFYQTDRFIVYFYLGGQDIGKFAVVDAEKELSDIETKMEYKLWQGSSP